MPVWNHTLQLADLFDRDTGDGPFAYRDEIVRRIKASKFWNEDETELIEIVDELEDTDTPEYFDLVWDAFYDWADANRVWVATF
jgi:hypothetical protein